MQKTAVIINPHCHQGKGWKRWLSIRDDIQKRLPVNSTEIVLEKGLTLKEALSLNSQQTAPTLIISAGGDGSIHHLVNHLLKEEKENLPHITIGAIGLGSSNDFLKPFNEKLKGIPVRINQTGRTLQHDVGIASYIDISNFEQKKFFVINASVGVTAEANWSFNHPGAFLRLLKKRATGAAIFYTALSTIVRHQNSLLSLQFNGKNLQALISNINVLKLPYVSGSFYYNQAIRPDDGQLGINVCMNMSRYELLSVLNNMQKGEFSKSPKTLSEFTTSINITADQYFAFECDGETEKTCSLNLRILPKAFAVLQN